MSKSADKILKTAESLFNAHSFVSVGVDLIRDESGCSKTTLYTYFKNKQQLVQAVLTQRDQHFRKSLISTIKEKNDLATLEAIFDWHIQWFQTDHFKGCLFVRAVSETDKQEQEIHTIALAHKQWLYQLIATQTKQLMQTKAITDLFYTQLEGLISRFMVEGFQQEVADQQKQLIFKLIQILETSKL